MDLSQKQRMVASVVAVIVSLSLLGYMAFGSLGFGGATPGAMSRQRTLIDAKSLEVFVDYPVPDDTPWPLKNPSTGELSLFPAEACYWTKSGEAKLRPTWVLLNSYAGRKGATICPDCGRAVMMHNPFPPLELMEKAK